jgi:hypothetical protein
MDWTKPTTQLLGRFQPWHRGHTELFKRALSKTGQVAILLRTEDGTDDNPYDHGTRCQQIILALQKEGYYDGQDFSIFQVPNITHITYGRKVGYKIEEEFLDEELELVSATEIRRNLNSKNRKQISI